MNAPDSRISADLAAKVKAQLNVWGVTPDEVNKDLLEYATNIVRAPNTRIGDIVVQFGFATTAEIEQYAGTKPTNVLLLDHLAERVDNLRPHTQKLLGANDRLAYYESLVNAPICDELQTDARLRTFCEHHFCLPLTCNADNTLRLVFADYSAQKMYAQSSRAERAGDAITQLQQSRKTVHLIYGIAKREQIAAELHNKPSAASDVLNDEEKLNVWYDKNAATPTQKLLARMLAFAAEKKASNLQFEPNHNGTVDVKYRRHGNYRSMPNMHPLSIEQADEINRFLHIKMLAKYTSTAKHVEGRLLDFADGQMVYKNSTSETFLRGSFVPVAADGLSHHLESISLRLLPRDAININLCDLRLSPKVIDVLRHHLMQSHGLILIVGQTSSGKSTSIAGMVSLYQEIFGNSRHLLSLEQPVERRLQGITQIEIHQNNFESGMAALLRHDPDFIWVGEMRDRPSASTCIRAANTGHIVVSTLHADDTPTAFNALISYISNATGSRPDSVIVSQYDAISALSLIVAQRLIPTLCPHCKLSIMHSGKHYSAKLRQYEEYCARNEFNPTTIDKTYVHNPSGCDKCDHEGYDGELPINEVLPVTRDLRRKLNAMANAGQNDLEILEKQRSSVLFDEAMLLVLSGQVAINDALI